MGTTDQSGFVAAAVIPADVARMSVANFTLPLALLAAFALLIRATPALPPPFAPLGLYVPYAALGGGFLVSLGFKRGRALFALLALLLAYAAYRVFLPQGLAGFPARTVFAALCLFVPLDLALLAALPERGALNPYGIRRLILVLLEVSATLAVLVGNYRGVTQALYRPLLQGAAYASPVPQLCVAVIALALAAGVACAVAKAGTIEAALAVAAAAFAAACAAVGTNESYAWFSAAGVIITVGVLQDSYRMAFNDELTGLPGRRALNEKLMGLEGEYAVAMIDVDHFKRFNDEWGHDVGDQVLKLVASRLKRVRGGGRAYRYGGEEFAIVFPAMRIGGAFVRSEAVRADIERYRFEIRSRERRRSGGGAPRAASVTVSVGVAATSDWRAQPAAVLHAADRALYRAKHGGRNRVELDAGA
jgi:diguanylate cyclase (GGDEF)-like protein